MIWFSGMTDTHVTVPIDDVLIRQDAVCDDQVGEQARSGAEISLEAGATPIGMFHKLLLLTEQLDSRVKIDTL
jgi:hypothetical protein